MHTSQASRTALQPFDAAGPAELQVMDLYEIIAWLVAEENTLFGNSRAPSYDHVLCRHAAMHSQQICACFTMTAMTSRAEMPLQASTGVLLAGRSHLIWKAVH